MVRSRLPRLIRCSARRSSNHSSRPPPRSPHPSRKSLWTRFPVPSTWSNSCAASKNATAAWNSCPTRASRSCRWEGFCFPSSMPSASASAKSPSTNCARDNPSDKLPFPNRDREGVGWSLFLQIQNYLPRVARHHQIETVLEIAERKPVRNHRTDIEARFQHHRHLVPGLVHLTPVDPLDREHVEDHSVPVDGYLIRRNPQHRDLPAMRHI